jgi:hypothetical protein
MASIKPGDRVRFLDEVGEGRVVRILSGGFAEVETTDGWVIPYLIKQLVVIPEEVKKRSGSGGDAYAPGRIRAAVQEKEVASVGLNRPAESKPSNIQKAARIIDLHVNKLVENVVGLTNTDILNIQLECFRREMNAAIRSNEREIIFVHGIGNGTLRNELRRVAARDYAWCTQEDASFRDFGFGATRIRIPQNKPV